MTVLARSFLHVFCPLGGRHHAQAVEGYIYLYTPKMLEFEKSKYSAVHDLVDGVAAPPHAKPQRCLSMCQAGCDIHGSPVLQRYSVWGGAEQNSHFVYPPYKFEGSLISTGNFEQNSRA